jgi:hypothetical protein
MLTRDNIRFKLYLRKVKNTKNICLYRGKGFEFLSGLRGRNDLHA